jgi:predicted nuclease of predicted toxin-antitoxin system
VRLALDNHYSPSIARLLRDRGHDVVAVVELEWQREEDEVLLARCASDVRTLLTNNVADFAVIARTWQMQGRHHAGLLYTSDSSMPRHGGMIGVYVRALDALMKANPASDAFADRVHWLSARA